jgi:hypothetical protein
MLSIEIFFLKALLIIPLFALYVLAAYLFVLAANEQSAKVRRCWLIAGWTAVAAEVFFDVEQWIRPMPDHLNESTARAGMVFLGLSLGMYIATMIHRGRF